MSAHVRRRIIGVALVALMAHAGGTAPAASLCARGTLTAPAVGTRSAGTCVPDPMTDAAYAAGCVSVPPAAVVVCYALTVPHPL